MINKYDIDYALFLENKRVAIVGPAPYIIGMGDAELIDSHDIVVRLNRAIPVPDHLKPDIGERTDILYNSLNDVSHQAGKIDIDLFINSGIKWVCSTQPRSQKVLEDKYHKKSKGRLPLHVVEPHYYDSITIQVGGYPNCGMISILDVLYYNIKSLYITGFSFFQPDDGGEMYYKEYRNPDTYNDCVHNAKYQYGLMKKIYLYDRRISCDTFLNKILSREPSLQSRIHAASNAKKGVREKRRYEKLKYLKIYKNEKTSYGKTNHGKHIYSKLKEMDITSLCDVGCGDGELCRWVKKNICSKVFGVDFAIKPKGAGIYWMREEAHDIRLPDKYVDYVTSFDMMEHLIPEDIDPSLAEFSRISKKGMILSISYCPSQIKVDGEGLHPTVKPESWWIKKLSTYGEVEKWKHYLLVHFKKSL